MRRRRSTGGSSCSCWRSEEHPTRRRSSPRSRLAGVEGALYEDVNDPTGVALVALSESPDSFVSELRDFLQAAPFSELEPKPELTMLGRTYAIGHEQDLEEALVERPRGRVLDPEPPVGDLVPASPRRLLRAALAEGAERDPDGARWRGDGVRPGGARLRHPARVPRARQARQRLRGRAARPRAAPALDHRPADAEDAADLAPPRAAGAVLRRQGGVAEPRRRDRGSAGATRTPSRRRPSSARVAGCPPSARRSGCFGRPGGTCRSTARCASGTRCSS